MANYAKMENNRILISQNKKEGYKPLIESKPEGYEHYEFAGYIETPDNIAIEYIAVIPGVNPEIQMRLDITNIQAQQEITDAALQDLIIASMEGGNV